MSGFEPYFKDKWREELFKNIKIFIKDENLNTIYITSLKSRKDKFAVHIKKEGVYQICARYYIQKRGQELPEPVVLGLKIRNDFQYKELETSLHKEDVRDFWKKIRQIKEDMFPSLQAERKEIEEEDKTAKSIIKSVDLYYALCCIQLVIIIIITLSTVFYLKSFFKSKAII